MNRVLQHMTGESLHPFWVKSSTEKMHNVIESTIDSVEGHVGCHKEMELLCQSHHKS